MFGTLYLQAAVTKYVKKGDDVMIKHPHSYRRMNQRSVTMTQLN